MTMNIQDRIDDKWHALRAAVAELSTERLIISVTGEVFETLLVLFDVHEVTVGKYHDGRRFLQLPAQRVADCRYVAVSTDAVPEGLPDVRTAVVEWGSCPDCGEPSFVYSGDRESAADAVFLYGMGPLVVVRPS